MKYSALILSMSLALASAPTLADFAAVKRLLAAGETQEATAELIELAQNGHVEAQFELANAYQKGDLVEADLNKAFAWYLIAQDFGHPDAKAQYSAVRKQVTSRMEAKQHYHALSKEFGKKAHEEKLKPSIKQDNYYVARAKIKNKVEPQIPADIRAGSNVWISVAYNINESGFVEDARVLAAVPKGLVEDYVLDAVKQWQFEPNVSATGELRRTFDMVESFEFRSSDSKLRREFDASITDYADKLRELAANGNSYAQTRYALMLEHNIIPAKSTNEHIEWYYQAAINGNNEAQMRMVHCLNNGEGCYADKAKAYHWLQKASKTGNERAQYQLAMELLDFDSIHYDVAKATSLLKEATHNQYLPAMIEYSKLLAFSRDANLRNPQEAVKYAELARAMDNNNPVLLSVLGTAYSELGRFEQGHALLEQALNEANSRSWPAKNYLNLIEKSKASMMADTNL